MTFQTIICWSKCDPCKFEHHYDPPQAHSWGEPEDVQHAKDHGWEEPGACQCLCADVNANQALLHRADG